jgi:hypothetical protein
MAYYLVSALPRGDRMPELERQLAAGAFLPLEPFGEVITSSLRNARRKMNGTAIWEEEDYCSPPLRQERAAVLDRYFYQLQAEPVRRGEGWRRISGLPALFPSLTRQEER